MCSSDLPCNGCLGEFNDDSSERMSLTLQEQEGFLGFIQQSKVYSVHYPLIVFMIGTAVRCGEAIGMTWADVDFMLTVPKRILELGQYL